MKIPELPDWRYDVQETSMGVYNLKARDSQGRVIDLTGTDPNKLIQEFIETAKRINLAK